MKSFAIACSIICLVGCGDGRPTRVPISGQVLIDGKPLDFGFIQLMPANARASEGKLDSNGRFTLACYGKDDGAVLGRHTVVVLANETLSPTKIRWHAPKKYADYRTSGLTQEITGAMDNLVINLTWDGGRPFVEDSDSGEERGFRPGTHNKSK